MEVALRLLLPLGIVKQLFDIKQGHYIRDIFMCAIRFMWCGWREIKLMEMGAMKEMSAYELIKMK